MPPKIPLELPLDIADFRLRIADFKTRHDSFNTQFRNPPLRATNVEGCTAALLYNIAELKKTGSKKQSRFSDNMASECLRILESGDTEELFETIPRIGVLRDPRFKEPLISLLSDRDLKKREFAAYALGAMGSREFFAPLKDAFGEAAGMKAIGAEEFLVAVIEAIGAIGDDAAAEFFLQILKKDPPHAGKSGRKLGSRIVESLGAIAQQGGEHSVKALIVLTRHEDPEICAHAVSELSIAFWHRPNEISDAALQRVYELTSDTHAGTAESALSALQSLADVGCRRAEKFFTSKSKK